MNCFCCHNQMNLARKVKVRRLMPLSFDPTKHAPDSAAYISYREEVTYRWGVVCLGCYDSLDSNFGCADIAGRTFNIESKSRGNKATTINQHKYDLWQKKEEDKLWGLSPVRKIK